MEPAHGHDAGAIPGAGYLLVPPNNIEINSKQADKGIALQILAERLGLTLGQTMAFGDELNDLRMLRTAGIGVAMGNAPSAVKVAADLIALDYDSDGVADVLEKFFPD